jgi:hypothetical protein
VHLEVIDDIPYTRCWDEVSTNGPLGYSDGTLISYNLRLSDGLLLFVLAASHFLLTGGEADIDYSSMALDGRRRSATSYRYQVSNSVNPFDLAKKWTE